MRPKDLTADVLTESPSSCIARASRRTSEAGAAALAALLEQRTRRRHGSRRRVHGAAATRAGRLSPVKRLRAKIEPDPGNPVHIVTVRGLGF